MGPNIISKIFFTLIIRGSGVFRSQPYYFGVSMFLFFFYFAVGKSFEVLPPEMRIMNIAPRYKDASENTFSVALFQATINLI